MYEHFLNYKIMSCAFIESRYRIRFAANVHNLLYPKLPKPAYESKYK